MFKNTKNDMQDDSNILESDRYWPIICTLTNIIYNIYFNICDSLTH